MNTKEIKRLLSPYRKRISIEACTNTISVGMIAVIVAIIVEIIMYKFLEYDLNICVVMVIDIFVLLIVCCISYIMVFRPNDRMVALRLDERDLDERAVTMLEHIKEDTYISRIQRVDAINHIRQIKPKDIKPRLPLKKIITIVVLLILMIAISLIPVNNFKSNKDSGNSKAQLQALDDMVKRLEEKANKTNTNDATKKEIKNVLDKLKNDISKKDSYKNKADKVNKASDKIDDMLKKSKTDMANNSDAKKDSESDSKKKSSTNGQPLGDGGKKSVGKAEEKSDEKSSAKLKESSQAMGIDKENEEIYDVKEGKVPYDEVYKSYYLKALDEVDKNDASKQDTKVVEDYFKSLK